MSGRRKSKFGLGGMNALVKKVSKNILKRGKAEKEKNIEKEEIPDEEGKNGSEAGDNSINSNNNVSLGSIDFKKYSRSFGMTEDNPPVFGF